MKYTLHILSLFLALTLYSCSDDDDGNSAPISQLPPATQVGANTFGCLVNGEAFLPSGSGFGGPVLDCVYQFVDGGFYFTLQGNRRNNGKLQVVALITKNLQISEGIYELKEYTNGNASGAWWYSPNNEFIYIYTSETYTGELKITKLDEMQHIVSGTFWYDIQLPDGDLVEIREGRFDMQYTN